MIEMGTQTKPLTDTKGEKYPKILLQMNRKTGVSSAYIINRIRDLPAEVNTFSYDGRLFGRHLNANGEKGGFVESTANVSKTAFLGKDAIVLGKASVSGFATVEGPAILFGRARVSDEAHIEGNVFVFGNSNVYGNAHLYENAWAYGYSHISDNVEAHGSVRIYGHTQIYDDAEVCGTIKIHGISRIHGSSFLTRGEIKGNMDVYSERKKLLRRDDKPLKDFIMPRLERTTHQAGKFGLISYAHRIRMGEFNLGKEEQEELSNNALEKVKRLVSTLEESKNARGHSVLSEGYVELSVDEYKRENDRKVVTGINRIVQDIYEDHGLRYVEPLDCGLSSVENLNFWKEF